MKRQIVSTKSFEKELTALLAKRKATKEDFEDFKRSLATNPEQGAVISGTGA